MNKEFFLTPIEIKKKVLSAIESKTPLSLIRIGDGEIKAIIANRLDQTTINVYNKHIGYLPDQEIMYEISNLINNSILKCNILGLPNDKEILKGWGGIIEHVKLLENKSEWETKDYCSMNVHYDLLNTNLLDDLLKNIEKVILITCRDVKKRLLEKYPNIKNLKVYEIPKQYRFESDKKIEKFYPDVYNKIISDIKNNDYGGHLALLGGGFIGKNIAIEIANSNGVCIDIGSVFDAWVGKITRGPGKGPNSFRTPLL